MKKLTTQEEVEVAKEWVGRYVPESLIPYQWLKINIDRPDGLGTSKNSFCYVDRWPNPNILAGIDYINSYGYDDYPKFCMFTNYQASDSELVQQFLLDLSDKIGIITMGGFEAKGVSAQWRPLLDEVFSDKLSLDKSITAWPCSGYWLPQDEQNRLKQKSIIAPDGFEFGTLNLTDADTVDSTWPHRVEGSTLSLIRRQITHFPNVCLRTKSENRLTCFEMIEAEAGIMSHLYTMPEFRRRGLATLVETKLAQDLINGDQIPVKVVLHGNVAGEKITRASSMWKYFGETVWLRYGDEKMASLYAIADASSGH